MITAPDNHTISSTLTSLLETNNLDEISLEQLLCYAVSPTNHEKLLEDIRELIRQTTRTEAEEFLLWRRVGLHWDTNGTANSIVLERRANRGTRRQITSILGQAVTQASSAINRVFLISTNDPLSPLWEAGLPNTLKIICPANIDNRQGQVVFQATGGRLTFPLVPHGIPSQAQALTNDIGWAKDNIIWLRFNPFINPQNNNRFTAAREAARTEVLASVITSALPYLTLSNQQEEINAAWTQAVSYATSILRLAQSSSTPFITRTRDLVTEHRQALSRVEEIQAQLQEAEDRRQVTETALETTETLFEAAKQHAKIFVNNLTDQITKVQDMPQVDKVRLLSTPQHISRLEITTNPLYLNCGEAGLRNLGKITFTLPINGNEDPLFPHATSHPIHPSFGPARRPDLAAVSVPLAMALGAGQLQTATSLLCGLLARPHPTGSNEFPAPPEGSRAGFQS